ncbi:MAG: DUF104 domain-containing protein [Chloroflexi bacterium]|nr:DUF104 domain-containing protein [Chloroflexota bacterium]
MTTTVKATYANGVLTPSEPLDIEEGTEVTLTVRPGGKLEIVSEDLEAGQTADIVILHESSVTKSRSIMEILNSGPEDHLLQTGEEVKAYLDEEKASWER